MTTAADIPNLRSISNTFFRFTLAIILISGFSFVVITWLIVRTALDGIYEAAAQREVAFVQASIEKDLNARLSALRDHAILPIVVNGAMHPGDYASFVRDQLDNLRVLENDAAFAVLDINGEVVQTSSNFPESGFRRGSWIMDIADDRRQQYVAVDHRSETMNFILGVPITYNGLTEGVFVAVTPFALTELVSGLVSDQGTVIEIFADQQQLQQIGSKQDEPSYKLGTPLPFDGGRLELTVYKTELSEGMSRLIITFFVVAVLTSVLFFGFFRSIGRKLVIEPQQILENSRVQTLRANEKLSVANSELAQFAYRASHDLKAPLVTTSGLANAVCEDIEEGNYEVATKNASMIAGQVGRLSDLVDDILDLARADLEDVNEERVFVVELIDEIRDRLQALFEANEVELHVNVPSDLEVSVEKPRLVQILENLISNGMKYHRPEAKRWVSVAAEVGTQGVTIRVADNGLGIPQQFHDKVFEMFTRFHPAASFGSGLGLYIVQKHADKLGASLQFSSSDQGSEFVVTLPMSCHVAAQGRRLPQAAM